MKNIIAATTGKSFPVTELIASLPRPGQEKTVSTTVVPVINPINNNPEYVSGTIRAFLKACFQTTLVYLTPLALANLIYSVSITSSIEDLVSLKYPAAGSQPKTIAGSIKCLIEKQVQNTINISSGKKVNLIKACIILNKKYVKKEMIYDLKKGKDIYGDNALLRKLGIKKFKNITQSLLSYKK